MKNQKVSEYGNIGRVILLCLGLSFIFCLCAVCFVGANIKRNSAKQISDIVSPLLIKGLNREAVHILSSVSQDNFHALSYFDEENRRILTSPPSVSPSHFLETSFSKDLFYMREEIAIDFEDSTSTQPKGRLVFSIKRFENIGVTFFIWLILNFLTLPVFMRIYKLKRKDIESQLRIDFAKEQAESFRQVRHDIKNPLALLKAVAETTKGISNKDRNTILKVVEEIRSYLDGLKLKNHSKPQLTSCNEKIYLAVFMTHFIERQRSRFYKDSIDFSLELPKNFHDTFLLANEGVLTRVLENLVLNSVESIKKNEFSHGKVNVYIESNNGKIEILITDDGPGIDLKNSSSLFEKGFSNKAHGSGLGLNYAKSKCEEWGGSISLSSESGRGMQVKLAFPKASPESWTGPMPMVDSNKVFSLLDDDYNIHELLEIESKNSSIKTEAHHPKDLARGRLEKKNRFFLVDYDFGPLSPEMNGLKLIEKYQIADQSVLFTQNYDDPMLVKKCEKQSIKLLPKALLSTFFKNNVVETKKAITHQQTNVASNGF